MGGLQLNMIYIRKYFQILKSLKKNPIRKLVWLVILSIVVSLFEIVSIGVLIPLVTIMIEGGYSAGVGEFDLGSISVNYWIGIFVTAATVVFILKMVLLKGSIYTSHLVGNLVSAETFSRFVNMPLEMHPRSDRSALSSAILVKVDLLVSQIIFSSIQFVSSLVIMLLVSVFILYMTPDSALIIFGLVGLLYVGIIILIKKSVNNKSKILNTQLTKLNRTVSDSFSSIREIWVYGLIKRVEKTQRELDWVIRSIKVDNQFFAGFPRYAAEFIGILALSIYILLANNSSSEIKAIIPTLSALVFSLYPMALFYGVKGLTESVFLTFLLGAFLALYKNKIILTSILFVLTILSRPVTDLFAPIAIAWYSLVVRKDGVTPTLKKLSIYGLVYAVMMSPWWVHNYTKHNEIVRLNLGYGVVLYSGNNPMNVTGGGIGDLDYDTTILNSYSDPIEKDVALRSKAEKYISDNPAHFYEMMWVKFKRVWSLFPFHKQVNQNIMAIITTISLLPILIASFGTLVFRRDILLYLTPLIGFIVYLTLVHMITIGSIRYRYPMEIILILIASPSLVKCCKFILKLTSNNNKS